MASKFTRKAALPKGQRVSGEDLQGYSLAQVLRLLERGKIGHTAAMKWLRIESLNELCDIMYANGRVMPGHQHMEIAPETLELLRAITKPLIRSA